MSEQAIEASPEQPTPAPEVSVGPKAGESSAQAGKTFSRSNRFGRQRRPKRPARPNFDPAVLQSLAPKIDVGGIFKGQVGEVTEGAVFVKLQGPSGELQAAVPATEFGEAPSLGAEVSAFLMSAPADGDVPGTASIVAADQLSALADVRKAHEAQETITGTIEAEVKGGYAVSIGSGHATLRGFLPKSHGRHQKLHLFRTPIGETSDFQITEFDEGRLNIVLSRRKQMKEAYQALVTKTWASLVPGEQIEGRVRSIMPYGAFVDVGGVDGLLHQSDLSWDRAPRVSSVLSIGDVVKTEILSVDKDADRLKLGLKQLTPNPWQTIKDAIVVGADVEGDVVSLTDYGAFVRLAEGVEGLVHVSEVSWDRLKHVSSRLSIGDRVRARVLEVNLEEQRVSLSMRALEKNPYERVTEAYPAGTVLRAEVKSLTDFGAFIAIDANVDGMIHIGELSWTERYDHPSDLLTVGQEIEAVVLDVNIEKQRVACSIKQLTENPWKAWEVTYAPGTRHTLVCSRVTDKEATFTLPEGELVGICDVRDLSTETLARAQDVARVGESLEMSVRKLDFRRKRVLFSVKAVQEGDTRQAYQEYRAEVEADGGGRFTLGDALGAATLGLKTGDGDEPSGEGDA